MTRDDMQKPAVRMWLFGMVTMVELRYTRLIREMCPDESWRQYLSEGRLKKAEDLMAERRRRNRPADMLDCLQLSDKGQIVARDERIRSRTIFTSRRQTEEGINMLEGLRQQPGSRPGHCLFRLGRDRAIGHASRSVARRDARHDLGTALPIRGSPAPLWCYGRGCR